MVLTFASCDALDLKPISFITNESFWQTEDDVKGALNGIYVQLRGAAEHDLYILGEARSEILTVGIGGYGGYDIYYYNTLTQANMPISWIRYYQIVNSCNLLLKYAPNVTFNNETSRNKMLAQAYTMRAWIISNETRDLSRDSVNGVKDALLDLMCLSKTDKIIGSYFSSFTDIAADINGIPKIVAGEES